jgi:hypothetical protein
MTSNGYACLACGYWGLTEPPWRGGSASDEICPCCGLHFGYDDAFGGRVDLRPAFYHGWRLKWRKAGMRWWSPDPPPVGWDPEEQLQALRAGDIPEHLATQGPLSCVGTAVEAGGLRSSVTDR